MKNAHPLHAALDTQRELIGSISTQRSQKMNSDSDAEAVVVALQSLLQQRPRLDAANFLLAQAELLKTHQNETTLIGVLEASVEDNPFCSPCLYLLAQQLFGDKTSRTKQEAQQVQRVAFARLQQSWAADPNYWRAPWRLCSQLVKSSGGIKGLTKKSANAKRIAATACFRAAELIDSASVQSGISGSADSDAANLKDTGQSMQMRQLATHLLADISKMMWCDRTLSYV